MSLVSTRTRGRNRAPVSLKHEPPEGGSVVRGTCRARGCSQTYVRVLAPGANPKRFRLCLLCRERTYADAELFAISTDADAYTDSYNPPL